jgi:Sulfate permease family
MESDLSTRTMGTELRSPLVERRSVCGYHTRGICDTGSTSLCHARRLASTGWGVWLPAWRVRLCLIWFLPPLGDWPTSAISLMVGVSVVPLATGDPVRYAQIASLSAFVAAAMCVVAWLLRLSTLTSFISETVLLGFKAGAALSIAVPARRNHFPSDQRASQPL